MSRAHVLVVGKFLPLHAGHLALLDHARAVAGETGVVTVVLGPRHDDPVPPETRVDWLVRCAPWARGVVAAAARPNFRLLRRQEFVLKNGQDAIAEKCAFLPPTPRSRVLTPIRARLATDSGG